MCIRDSQNTVATLLKILVEKEFVAVEVLGRQHRYSPLISNCLLYTSDAADERSSVDLGGRRIIKKKKR